MLSVLMACYQADKELNVRITDGINAESLYTGHRLSKATFQKLSLALFFHFFLPLMTSITFVAAIYQFEPFFLLQKSSDEKNKITHPRAQDVPY